MFLTHSCLKLCTLFLTHSFHFLHQLHLNCNLNLQYRFHFLYHHHHHLQQYNHHFLFLSNLKFSSLKMPHLNLYLPDLLFLQDNQHQQDHHLLHQFLWPLFFLDLLNRLHLLQHLLNRLHLHLQHHLSQGHQLKSTSASSAHILLTGSRILTITKICTLEKVQMQPSGVHQKFCQQKEQGFPFQTHPPWNQQVHLFCG